MVNNIVYFGRIIATILLIRPIRLISLIRPIHLVRLISHSRATLAPLLSSLSSCPSGPSASSVFRPVWTPDSGLPPVPKVLTDPFPLGPPTNFNSWGERRH